MRESLEAYVARIVHVREADIFGDKRDADLVKARQLCMGILREFTDKSFIEIGKRYGRDHATVIHAVKCFKRFSHQEDEYRELAQRTRDAVLEGMIYLPFVDIEPMYEECLIELQ